MFVEGREQGEGLVEDFAGSIIYTIGCLRILGTASFPQSFRGDVGVRRCGGGWVRLALERTGLHAKTFDPDSSEYGA